MYFLCIIDVHLVSFLILYIYYHYYYY